MLIIERMIANFEYVSQRFSRKFYKIKKFIYTAALTNVHVTNYVIVVLSWVNTMLVAMLPRFAWMNPEMSSGIFGEFNSMRGRS